MSPVGGPAQPPHERPGYTPMPYDSGAAQRPPGFGEPGQVPTLNGQPLAAPRSGMSKGIVASLAFFGVLLVVAVAGILFTGGRVTGNSFRSGGSGTITVAPARPRTSASATARPSGPVPKPVRYSGTGDKTFDIRRPEPGDTLVYVKGNAGGGVFLVFALDESGRQIGIVANATQPYEGVRLLDTTSFLQAHALEVQGEGRWTVELRSARSAEAFTSSASGRGDSVLRYEGKAGTASIRGGSAYGLFLVMTRKNGFPTPLVSKAGVFDGTKPWPAGPFLVEVQSSGPWSVRVAP